MQNQDDFTRRDFLKPAGPVGLAAVTVPDAINRPVTVGGALVRPYDMVVADGDGVVIVPREHAEKVAEIAWDIAGGDKKGRKNLYDQMGLKPDETAK